MSRVRCTNVQHLMTPASTVATTSPMLSAFLKALSANLQAEQIFSVANALRKKVNATIISRHFVDITLFRESINVCKCHWGFPRHILRHCQGFKFGKCLFQRFGLHTGSRSCFAAAEVEKEQNQENHGQKQQKDPHRCVAWCTNAFAERTLITRHVGMHKQPFTGYLHSMLAKCNTKKHSNS